MVLKNIYFKQQHQQCISEVDDVSYVALPYDLQKYFFYTFLFNLEITAFQKDQRGKKHLQLEQKA